MLLQSERVAMRVDDRVPAGAGLQEQQIDKVVGVPPRRQAAIKVASRVPLDARSVEPARCRRRRVCTRARVAAQPTGRPAVPASTAATKQRIVRHRKPVTPCHTVSAMPGARACRMLVGSLAARYRHDR